MPWPPNRVADANRISDRVVDLIRNEIEKGDVSPVMILTGVTMGLLSLISSSPNSRPEALTALDDAARALVREILDSLDEEVIQ